MAIEIAGPLNARVIVETSDAIGGLWTVATTFQLNRQGQEWSVPIEIQQSGRFFRVRIETPR